MSNNETIFAAVVLSPLEMDVATMARMDVGRNAISVLFNLSPNSVKKLLQRIEDKLGPDWQKNPCIIWPEQPELAATSEAQEEGDETLADTWEGGYCQRLEKELLEQEKSHRVGRYHFIHKDAGGREILHVTGAQRFWLKPVLTELEERKLIKLLAVDWTEPFAPHWLPLLSRGRKQIRTAGYTLRDAGYVMQVIELYLDVGLEEYLRQLSARLDEVRNARHPRKKVVLPDFDQLKAMALADMESGKITSDKLPISEP
ncbi:hypothetical protein SY88_00180 [Clostridiales bacterium PH28_bin88]|nr:hypothetical protein SY88_00180 [Clostridiales bacterium PH28_bin88]